MTPSPRSTIRRPFGARGTHELSSPRGRQLVLPEILKLFGMGNLLKSLFDVECQAESLNTFDGRELERLLSTYELLGP